VFWTGSGSTSLLDICTASGGGPLGQPRFFPALLCMLTPLTHPCYKCHPASTCHPVRPSLSRSRCWAWSADVLPCFSLVSAAAGIVWVSWTGSAPTSLHCRTCALQTVQVLALLAVPHTVARARPPCLRLMSPCASFPLDAHGGWFNLNCACITDILLCFVFGVREGASTQPRLVTTPLPPNLGLKPSRLAESLQHVPRWHLTETVTRQRSISGKFSTCQAHKNATDLNVQHHLAIEAAS